MVLFCRLYVNLHGFGKISTMLFCFAVVEMAPKKFFFIVCRYLADVYSTFVTD